MIEESARVAGSNNVKDDVKKKSIFFLLLFAERKHFCDVPVCYLVSVSTGMITDLELLFVLP